MSFQAMSASITSITNPVDTVLTIYGPNGKVVATNDDQFEPSDSSIFDLILPATGTYTVEVERVPLDRPVVHHPRLEELQPRRVLQRGARRVRAVHVHLLGVRRHDRRGHDPRLRPAEQPGQRPSVSRLTFTSEAGLHAVTFLGPITPGADNNPFAENVQLAAAKKNRRG